MIDLGNDFDRAVLRVAGLDPDKVQLGSLTIDMVPTTGPATIRFTMVSTIDSGALRSLIASAAQAATPSAAAVTATVTAAVKT